MDFILPIYVEEHPSPSGQPPQFVVRPLFKAAPERRSERLSRALDQLSNDLHSELKDLGRELRHDALVAFGFGQTYDEATVTLRLELNSGSHSLRVFLVGYAALGRRIFCAPSLPEVIFEVNAGQDLTARATEVFARHFREVERKGGDLRLDRVGLATGARARLITMELAMQPAHKGAKERGPSLADIFGGGLSKPDGETELRKVGRRMRSLYPDELDRAVGREVEVAELQRMLGARERRSILLVGPRQVGKTAIIHEVVWRKHAEAPQRERSQGDLWLVSPMRLISGMSHLGEWENRVLAIFEHAAKRDLVLCFDDLLGLFTAGQSAGSDLSVAHLLRPRLEQRDFRVLAEITPEALQVLRERDRGLADVFQIIPVPEPSERETLRILTSAVQQFEEQHRCQFGLEVVPTAYELYRRFAGDAAFPGKAAGFLRRLGVKHAGGGVNYEQAMQEFSARSGLSPELIDGRITLSRAEILVGLRRGVSGQEHALEAFADALVLLKARLNDPRRPLTTFLLVGPTGVGKTQSAKALASFLFGSEDRLLRFDMNEFVDAGAVARLTGSAQEPDGLLTSAIRRQPFAVVLLDEIEKAAPEVFDLLLAVLDEGRVSDGLGRVASFTNAVILLTSNLGAREARSKLGFASADESDEQAYVRAAEKFFRPEFFNRIDRVIPFRELSRQELEKIAEKLVDDVLGRDGLRRRQCLLTIAPSAMAQLVELGHHPQLGARALKRTIEREVAQPLARRLSGMGAGAAMLAEFTSANAAFQLRMRELRPVVRTVEWPELIVDVPLDTILAQARAAMNRLECVLAAIAPSGPVELTNLRPEQARYFHCREQMLTVEQCLSAAEAALNPRRRTGVRPMLPARVKGVPDLRIVKWDYSVAGQQRGVDAFRDQIAELSQPEMIELRDSPVAALLRELSLLEAMATAGEQEPRGLVFVSDGSVNGVCMMHGLAKQLHTYFETICGMECEATAKLFTFEDALLNRILGEPDPSPVIGLHVKGTAVATLAAAQAGNVMARTLQNEYSLIRIHLIGVDSLGGLKTTIQLGADRTIAADGEVIPLMRTLDSKQGLSDHATGLAVGARPDATDLRALFLSALPLPTEIEF